MTEEGIDTGGKAGMSRKLAAGIVVAAVVAAGIGAAIWWDMQDNSGAGSSQSLIFYFDTEYSDAEWRITIVDVFASTINYTDPARTFYETHMPPLKDNNSFANIRDTPSPLGIRWHDVNNDNLVNVGDYLSINRTGGSGGKLEAHKHILFYTDYGGSPMVYLPPAEFLDIDVVKTATGWNMTVTWVNETVPVGVMSGSNVSFRVEDINGDYFGERPGVYIGDISPVPKEYWRTALRLIDNSLRDFSDANHNYYFDQGAYNISWFDNDMNNLLSVGDVILIENYSGLVEHGYSFRLLCKNYGWMHTIHNLTLS